MTTKTKYRCLQIETGDDAKPLRKVEVSLPPLGSDNVLVQIEYSSLNYKDALAATGHPGVALTSPLIPGIDAAGVVIESNSPDFSAGDRVLVAHEEFGTSRHGGWAEFTIVPSDWVISLPVGMSTATAATLGTAAFTAAQSVQELQARQIEPSCGPIVVTGATGGVGIASVILLSELGYEVVAVSGKPEQHDLLKQLGASEALIRSEMIDDSNRPLLKGRFSGAVDSVGGSMLSTVIRSMKRGGCVTACGLVGGADFSISVYPFILRGIALQGIDSAGVSYERRKTIWEKLGSDWKMPKLDEYSQVISFDQVAEYVQKILAGQVVGRTVIKLAD